MTALTFGEEFEYKYLNYIFMLVILGIFIYERVYGITHKHVGYNYKRVIHERQWWRAYTSTVSHSGWLHLVLNEFGLWGCGSLQLVLGTVSYLKFTLLIFTINKLLIYPLTRWLLCKYWPAKFVEQERDALYTIGYGSTLFGLMGLTAFVAFGVPVDWECQRCDQWTIVFGAFPVDSPVANGFIFILVALAYIPIQHFIFPNSDTVAACTGLATGLICGFGTFIWFNVWCFLVLFIALLVVLIVSVWLYSGFNAWTHCFKPASSFPEPKPSESSKAARNSEEMRSTSSGADHALTIQESNSQANSSLSTAPTSPSFSSESLSNTSSPPVAAENGAGKGGRFASWFSNGWSLTKKSSATQFSPPPPPPQPPQPPQPQPDHRPSNQRSAYEWDDPFSDGPKLNENKLTDQQQKSAWEP